MGALWEQVTKTFVFLVGGANGIAKSFEQYEEHACIHRNGKGYRRIAVEIKEPNYHFASLNDMCLLIEARLKAENPCKVTFMKDYQQFINI